MRFEAHGRPAVCVITSAFDAAVRSRARALGMQGHPIVTMSHPLATRTAADINAEARALFDAIVRGLTCQESS